jgi:hypothetical protein
VYKGRENLKNGLNIDVGLFCNVFEAFLDKDVGLNLQKDEVEDAFWLT